MSYAILCNGVCTQIITMHAYSVLQDTPVAAWSSLLLILLILLIVQNVRENDDKYHLDPYINHVILCLVDVLVLQVSFVRLFQRTVIWSSVRYRRSVMNLSPNSSPSLFFIAHFFNWSIICLLCLWLFAVTMAQISKKHYGSIVYGHVHL